MPMNGASRLFRTALAFEARLGSDYASIFLVIASEDNYSFLERCILDSLTSVTIFYLIFLHRATLMRLGNNPCALLF